MYCTLKGHGAKLFHSEKLPVQCDEDWKLSTLQQKIFTSRKKITKHVLLWEKYQWNDIHFETYQYLFYFSGNNFILCPDFITSGKRNFVEFEWSAKRGRRSFGFCFSLFGGKISCHFTGCILQIFSVDVDIDVNTNFYLNTLDYGSVIISMYASIEMTHFWLW